MRRFWPKVILVLVVGCALTVQSASAQTSPDHAGSPDSPLLTTSRALHASLERISRGSRLWRDEVETARQRGGRVLVVTPAEVAMGAGEDHAPLDSRVLAETFPVAGEDARVGLVVVVVNLQRVSEIHHARMSVQRDVEADLDRILVHEIYGHALPYLVAGHLSGRCADPVRGQSASDACSIARENAVRAELGLGRRSDQGLGSLALAHVTR